MVRCVGSRSEQPEPAGQPDPATAERWPRRRHGDPVTVLAHRGGTGPWRENTVEAFTAALRLGADGVELDVRRSADGELVVHHDAEVPGSGLIHDCRRDQLPEWVPTLGPALAACAGAVVNVEIKNLPTDPGYDPAERVALDVASVLARGLEGRARILVSSFWPDSLAVLSRHDGVLSLGLLVHPALDALAALETATGLGCVALHPHHSRVSGDLVDRAHGLGLAVVTWTVNSPDEIDAVVDAGVDVVITDSVADTLAHLGRH
jgi:glycerophosphoryl diester phosphodiesterase